MVHVICAVICGTYVHRIDFPSDPAGVCVEEEHGRIIFMYAH